jgi:copper chaperone CopZ
MHKKKFKVANISCGHCVRTIESELSDLDNVNSVKADESTKMVEISWKEPQTWENIKSLLNEINYPVTEA